MSALAAFTGVRLHHFGISVADLEETVEWYREKLGFEILFRYEIAGMGARVAFLGLDGVRVEIFEIEGSSPMPDSRRDPASDLAVGGLKHASFAVEDLDGAMEELKGRGVEFVTDANEVSGSGGDRFAFFRDNNGILLELYEPVGA